MTVWTRLLTAGAGAAVIAAAAWSGAIPHTAPEAPTPFTGTITPDAQPLACPGPVQVPVGDIDAGDPDLRSGSEDVEFERVAAQVADAGSGFGVSEDAAAQTERVGDGDVAGLAAAPCLAPQRESWLVGGSTALGSSARLVLTNPTDASTEVTVTYFGALGPLEDRTVISVGAHAQQEVLLEAVVPEVASLVARVEASGAGVVASLQDSRLDGFLAAGTDWVVPAATPATSLVLPAVGAGTAASGTEVTVRLVAPEGATVSLTLDGPNGAESWGGVSDLVLEPGVVREVVVPASEQAAIEVEADAPVTAGAMIQVPRSVEDGPRGALEWDLAWSTAQTPADGAPRSAVTASYVRAVAVQSSDGGDFTLTADDGTVLATATVPPQGAVTVPLRVPAGRTVTGAPGFAWELLLDDQPGFVARISPRRTDIPAVTVVVREDAYVERARDGQEP